MNEHVRKQSDGAPKSAVHPGAGRRKGLMHPKGRVLDPADRRGWQSSWATANPSERC